MYKIKKNDKGLCLVYVVTSEEEYKVVSVDPAQNLLAVSAIRRDDRIKIPFSRVANLDMDLLERYFPEYFI
jgi:hypothetical protein|tara:strand:+ start:938 stop:1150 length:213 start_codon:yes stop_codon:yes gene_type:complete